MTEGISILINTDSNKLSVEGTSIVHVKSVLEMRLDGQDIQLPVDIQADFKDVPKEYHGLFLECFKHAYSVDYAVNKPKNVRSSDDKPRSWFKKLFRLS
jgi:hypothetical protein